MLLEQWWLFKYHEYYSNSTQYKSWNIIQGDLINFKERAFYLGFANIGSKDNLKPSPIHITGKIV